jgi:hypothetical protein
MNHKRGYFQVFRYKFKFWTSRKNTYLFQGIEINAELAMKLYPNWIMRVYHDISDPEKIQQMQSLEDRYGHILDFCFAGDLPELGNVSGLV